MYKRKIKKIILEIAPLLLIFAGSIMLTFSLKLINSTDTMDLGNGITKTGGGMFISDVPLSIPQQNDTLFTLGMIFFIAGSIWEVIKIILKNFQTSANNE